MVFGLTWEKLLLIAVSDPANVVAVRYFGEARTEQLVRALWGGDRELPRPLEV